VSSVAVGRPWVACEAVGASEGCLNSEGGTVEEVVTLSTRPRTGVGAEVEAAPVRVVEHQLDVARSVTTWRTHRSSR